MVQQYRLPVQRVGRLRPDKERKKEGNCYSLPIQTIDDICARFVTPTFARHQGTVSFRKDDSRVRLTVKSCYRWLSE
jgi:hypothetical protein